jgi:glutathione S-transferase
MESEFDIYADALGRGPFILGDRMSAVDIYAAMLATWVPDIAALHARHPNIAAMGAAVADHPAVAETWARNGM